MSEEPEQRSDIVRNEDGHRRVLTIDEWTDRLVKMQETDPDAALGPKELRDYLATMISEIREPIMVVLFDDPDVKNYFVLPFRFKDKAHLGFDVCFKRQDGHYPSDKPLLDIFLTADNLIKDEELVRKQRTIDALVKALGDRNELGHGECCNCALSSGPGKGERHGDDCCDCGLVAAKELLAKIGKGEDVGPDPAS